MKFAATETIDRSNLLVELSATYYGVTTSFEGLAEIEMPKWRILFLIYRNEGCTQKRLTELIRVAPASITRQVKLLEAGQLIRREADVLDNRLTWVFLTESGKTYVEQKLDLRRQFFETMLTESSFEFDRPLTMLTGLSDAEVVTFLLTMRRVRANLGLSE